jgi:hypothetical protein
MGTTNHNSNFFKWGTTMIQRTRLLGLGIILVGGILLSGPQSAGGATEEVTCLRTEESFTACAPSNSCDDLTAEEQDNVCWEEGGDPDCCVQAVGCKVDGGCGGDDTQYNCIYNEPHGPTGCEHAVR